MAKSFWEDDAPASSEAAPSASKFWEGDADAAQQALPKDVKPSTASGGRGAVNPPLAAAMLSDAEAARPAGAMGRTIQREAAPDRRSLLERSVDGAAPGRVSDAELAALADQERRSTPAQPRSRTLTSDLTLDPARGTEPRSVPRAAADTALGLYQGAAGMVKGVADNVNAGNNPASDFLETAIKGADRLKSDELRNQQVRRQGRVESAQRAGGELAGARAALQTLFDMPAAALDVGAQGAGSLIPTLLMGAAGAGPRIMGAVNAASTAGDSAQQVAEKLRKLPATVWDGDDKYRALLQAGMNHEQAVAALAPIYALPAQGAGALAGFISGRTGAEKAITGRATGTTIGSRLQSMLAEHGGEQLETLLPGVAGNAVLGAVDGKTGLLEGMGAAAVDTAAGTLAPGAVAGVRPHGAASSAAAPASSQNGAPSSAPRPAPTAEPPADTVAQIAALRDPSSGKTAALLTPSTPTAGLDLRGLQTVDTPMGTFVTADPDVAQAVAQRGAAITDAEMGQLLGYVTPKDATDGTVVQALDPQGNVVHEEATNAAAAPAAAAQAAQMAPAGGAVAQTDAAAALARREERMPGALERAAQAVHGPDPVAPTDIDPHARPRTAAQQLAAQDAVAQIEAEQKARADFEAAIAADAQMLDASATQQDILDTAAAPPAPRPSASETKAPKRETQPAAPATEPQDERRQALPDAPAAAPAARAEPAAPAPRPTAGAADRPARAQPAPAETSYPSVEAATDFIKAQRRRGTNVVAVPYTAPDGSVTVAAQGSPNYAAGVEQREQRRQSERRAAAGIMEGDITRPDGQPFANRRAAMNRAGAGQDVVEVQGGFVVRPQKGGADERNTTVRAERTAGDSDRRRGADTAGGVESALGRSAEPAPAVSAEPARFGAPAEPARVGAAGGNAGALTFKTAKGSTYTVNGQSTARNKAARADIGHEGDSGPQEPSQRTFYVDQAGLDALGEFQTRGAAKRRVVVSADAAALQYVDGKDAGKIERRTQAKISNEPAVGLFPVELWKDGTVVHFGNAITEVVKPHANAAPDAALTVADRFPSVTTISGMSAGPGGLVKPRAIASGRPLYRETSPSGLEGLLMADQRAELYGGMFVTDNPDLALGQGVNVGVKIAFRPDALSGHEHQKPMTGDIAGREYQVDIVAPRAIQSIEMTAAAAKKLRGLAQRALRDFDRTELPKGRVRFDRKGLLPLAATTSVDAAAHEAATSPQNDRPAPTQAQKEAGNYKMGHLSGDAVQGLNITIENPKDSVRSGTSPDGTKWSNTMGAHYGYVKGSVAADGDHVDVFVGPAADRAPKVWVVDQVNADGSYDEAKALFGFMNKRAAVAAYRSSYDKGWKVGPVTEMTVQEFKDGLAAGRFKTPLDPELAKLRKPAISEAKGTTPAAPVPTKEKRATKAERAVAEAEAARAAFFTPGNIVRSYGGRFDEVLAYQPGPRWSVQVQAVQKDGQDWVRVGKPQDARMHMTQPSAKELAAGPVARVTGDVRYTEPRADGKPFPNAPARPSATPTPALPPLQRMLAFRQQFPLKPPSGMTTDQAVQWLSDRHDAEDAMLASITDAEAEGLLVPGSNGFVGVTKDTSDASKWRITRFDREMEPQGHEVYNNRKEVLDAAFSRYAAPTDAAPPAQPSAAQQRADAAAAEKKRRAAGDRARARAWEDNPGRAFLAKHGIALDLANEWAPGQAERRAALVQGFGPIFRKTGMQLDTLAQAAVEEGFLLEPDERAMHALIDRAIRKERVIPQYAAGVSENEMEQRIAQQRQFEEEAYATLQSEHLSDQFIDQLSAMDETDYADVNALLQAAGVTDEEIQAAQALAAAEAAQRRGGDDPGAVEGQPGAADASGAAGEGLTRPTAAQVVAQQERAAQGERADAAARRDRQSRLEAEAQLAEFTLTGSNRAADANPNQQTMFSAAEAPRVDTPAFRRWFGKSKVVDANGKPLVVYHGTSAPRIDIFDVSRAGEHGRAEGAGIYFTTDQQIAEGYGSHTPEGHVIAAYVSIQKPLDYHAKAFKMPDLQKLLTELAKREAAAEDGDWRDGFLSNFADTYGAPMAVAVREAAASLASEETAIDQLGGMIGAGVNAQLLNDALTASLGYDGFRSSGFSGASDQGGEIWVAMRSNQIKAIDNRGTFDPANPDIRMSTAGQADAMPSVIRTAAATEEHQQKAKDLLADLRKQRGQTVGLRAVEPSGEGQRAEALAGLRALAKSLFNHDVVFVEFDGPAMFNGAMSRAVPGTVFLRVDSPKPHMAILGHELLHALRAQNPNLYNAMDQRLQQLANDRTADFHVDLGDTYARMGRDMPKDWREELWADVVGDNFVDPEFWRGMAAADPGLMRRVANAITRWLDGVINKLTGLKPFGTDRFLRDANEARRVVTEGMRQFASESQARPPMADSVADLERQLEVSTPGLKIDLSETRAGTIRLNRIVAPERSQGIGTKAMEQITAYADAKGQRIELTPSADFGGSKPRLVAFYKRHGFVENKGRNRDAAISESMYREPSGAAMSTQPGVQVESAAFRRWFGDSKVVDADGKPLVVYHGTVADFDAFDNGKTGANDRGLWGRGHYFSASVDNANSYALRQGDGARLIAAYVSIQNPLILKTGSDLVTRLPDGTNTRELVGPNLDGAKIKQLALDGGHDGVIQIRPNGMIGDLVAYSPEQIKSAIGNRGTFDPANPDIRLSAADDTSTRSNPALTRAIFEGSMRYTRDQNGRPVLLADQQERYKAIDTDERGQMLLRQGVVTADQLKRWKASPLDVFDGAVNRRFRQHFERAGIVWRDDELRQRFQLDDAAIQAYRDLRAQADTSIARNAVAAMLRKADVDGAAVREQVQGEPMEVAAITLRDHLLSLATAEPARNRELTAKANEVIDLLDEANDRMNGGFVPDDMKGDAGGGWQSTVPGRLDRMIYELQDNRIDIKRTQEAITAAGRQIREEFDARLAETLFAGRVAKRTTDFLEREAQPLLADMARNGVDQIELGDYLHARAAPERNAQIAKVNPDMPDGGAGANSKGTILTNANARAYIEAIPADRRKVLEEMAKKVDAITKGTRSLLVAEGLEDAETIRAWERAYSTYVPMFREDVEFSRIVTAKRAMGSERKAVNVLANVLLQREAAINKAEKNRIRVSLYGLALTNPNPDFWVTIRPDGDAEQIQQDVVSMGVDPTAAEAGMSKGPMVSRLDPVTGKVTETVNPFLRNLPTAITAMVNGNTRILLLNEKDPRALRLALSLKGADDLTQLDIAGSLVGKTTRWLAAVNTQYNPAFGLVNFWRDAWGGIINLGSTPLRGHTAQVLAGMPGAMAGIAAHLRGQADRGKWSQLFEQFQQDGGQTGFREMFADGTARAEAVDRELARMQRGRADPRRVAGALLRLLSGFNDVMENAVRLSAYAAALDQGLSRPEAARLGRELTVDFNRKGRATRELGPLYAFFNAAVQGNERIIRTLRGPTGRYVIAGGLALGVAQALMLAAAGYDDEDVPDYAKARALIIPLFDKEKRYIAVPLPLGLHVLPNTGRVLTQMVIGDRKHLGRDAFNAVGEISGAFNPLGGGNIFTADGALRTLAPTVVDPIIELGFNRNFAGSPIEREARGETDTRPGFQRARESTQRRATGQAYLGISKSLNRLTGGSDYEPGMVSPTPERVRYVAQVALGGVLRETEKIIDTSVAAARGEKIPGTGVPVVGRFYGKVDEERTTQAKYYQNQREIETAKNKLAAAKKAGDVDAYLDIERRNPMAPFIKSSQRIERQIRHLNKLAVEVIGDPAQQKVVDDARVQAMGELNAAIEEAEKARRKPTIAEQLRVTP